MDSIKNGSWIIPFKKFSRLKVNVLLNPYPAELHKWTCPPSMFVIVHYQVLEKI